MNSLAEAPIPAVVDANLVIRRVLFPDDEPVQKLWESWHQESRRLLAPSLLPYEVTSVLFRYQRQGWLNANTTEIALMAALALPTEIIGDAELHLQAFILASCYNLPAAYDAHYLALAERTGADFFTNDMRLLNALQSQNLSWVKRIS